MIIAKLAQDQDCIYIQYLNLFLEPEVTDCQAFTVSFKNNTLSKDIGGFDLM